MSNNEMQKELESLRSEVAELSKARAGGRKKVAESEAAEVEVEMAAEASTVTEAAAIDVNDPDAVQAHLDKLLAQLEQEIGELPAITTLAVFSLGVLFGRLLR